jgi:ferredoxin-like protein FixX
LCTRCFRISRLRAKGVQPHQRKRWAKAGQRWSRDYHACVECGTTEIPHTARGLCQDCYMRAWHERRRQALPD